MSEKIADWLIGQKAISSDERELYAYAVHCLFSLIYPIAFASLTDCTGICDEQAKRIIIQEGMDEQQSIQATIHEVAYAKLNTLMEY